MAFSFGNAFFATVAHRTLNHAFRTDYAATVATAESAVSTGMFSEIYHCFYALSMGSYALLYHVKGMALRRV